MFAIDQMLTVAQTVLEQRETARATKPPASNLKNLANETRAHAFPVSTRANIKI
jgi:hypothetical protein